MKYRLGSPKESVDDFAGVVGAAGDLHTITRSTVPLLAWWREHAGHYAIPDVDLSEATARFEYPVPAGCATCGGRGKHSFTDVMLLSDSRAIAFEAKYTEPAYEIVNKWLTRGSNRKNRENVLNHWCHLIEEYTATPIDKSNLGTLVYQVVHRTASACAGTPTAGAAGVAYLIFDDGRDQSHYESELKQAAHVLDPANKISFVMIRVPTRRLPGFDVVSRRCDEATDQGERTEIIAEAIRDGVAMYEFDSPSRIVIQH
jgi:hypothetical protein